MTTPPRDTTEAEALAEVLDMSPICSCPKRQVDFCGDCIAAHILASDWLAADRAAQRAEATKRMTEFYENVVRNEREAAERALVERLTKLADEWEAVRCGVTSPGLRKAADELRDVGQQIKADNDQVKRDDYQSALRPLPTVRPDTEGER